MIQIGDRNVKRGKIGNLGWGQKIFPTLARFFGGLIYCSIRFYGRISATYKNQLHRKNPTPAKKTNLEAHKPPKQITIKTKIISELLLSATRQVDTLLHQKADFTLTPPEGLSWQWT